MIENKDTNEGTNKKKTTRSLFNLTRERVLAQKVLYCDRPLNRIVGFLRIRKPEQNLACWLIPCRAAIHTFGMSFDLDVALLDKEDKVVRIIRDLKPNRILPMAPDVHSAVEFVAGALKQTSPGDQFELQIAG
ncbi:MAG: DUF192 domain-containing protein [Candidatus Omnitrophica bacterium]|nr:DUF192 domain-containing protein [Candidatus Omnitrophota bacterium]